MRTGVGRENLGDILSRSSFLSSKLARSSLLFRLDCDGGHRNCGFKCEDICTHGLSHMDYAEWLARVREVED